MLRYSWEKCKKVKQTRTWQAHWWKFCETVNLTVYMGIHFVPRNFRPAGLYCADWPILSTIEIHSQYTAWALFLPFFLFLSRPFSRSLSFSNALFSIVGSKPVAEEVFSLYRREKVKRPWKKRILRKRERGIIESKTAASTLPRRTVWWRTATVI